MNAYVAPWLLKYAFGMIIHLPQVSESHSRRLRLEWALATKW